MASNQLNKVIHQLCRALGAPDEEMADGQLLQRFVTHHDEAAFAQLLERYGPMVLGVCRRALGTTPDAEDAFQATFLVLVRKAGSLRDAERVGNWLYGVACRVARRARTQLARRRPQVAEVPDMATAEPGAGDHGELRPLLDEELQRLPRKYRVPLVLCYLEGKTNEAAARQLRWPPGTVKTRLAKGRELLRDRLARRGLALSSSALVAALAPEIVSAAVPPALARSTLEAAGLYAAGSAAGTVSASVLSLAEGTVREAFRAKLPAVLAVLLACGLFVTGAGLVAYASLGSETPVAAESAATPEPPPPVLEDGGLAVSVEQRVRDWQPNQTERRLDEIGWAADLCTALRLARQHQRPVLVLDFGGDIATARCPASAFNLRAGALSNDGIIARLNDGFVCVHLNNRDYRPNGRAPAKEKAELERIHRQVSATGAKEHGNRVYLLSPDGSPVACADGCKVASAGNLILFLERWTGEAPSDRAGPVVAPTAQSRPPQVAPEALVLHLTARYLQRRGDALVSLQPQWGAKSNYFMRACPGENWIVLDAVKCARFLPAAGASVGTTWEVPPDVAALLFRAMYPPTEDNDLYRNRIEEGALKATVVAVSADAARARLEGRLSMRHRFAPDKDDSRLVRAELEGLLDFEPGRGRIRSLRLVSTRALYGKADFGIAVRSLPR